MAEAEPDKYRPKRAIVEPEPTPAPPQDEFDDEDRPKPLYRDEVTEPAAEPGEGGYATTTSPAAAAPGSDPTTPPRSITFTPRRTRSADDDDATMILPRTPSRRGPAADRIDDLGDLDDDERKPMNSKTKLALLIGGVAAVVVVGLAIGYAVIGVGNTPGSGASPSASTGTSADPSASTATPAGALLDDTSMLSATDGKIVASSRTWTVASTDQGTAEDASQAACFGTDAVEGQPTPQQKILRLLSSTGKNAPGLLHQATSYASPEEAVQAYAIATKTLGGCAVVGSYIVEGKAVTGVGDQAVGVVIATVADGKTQQHTIVVNRTGRVLNIIDASQPDDAIATTNVAKAAAAVTDRECAAAAGACGESVSVKDGPPPIGGDEPGFLATGDLPPAGKTPLAWVTIPPELPKDDFVGSGCETVNWSTLSTEATTSRIYLLQDSGSFFGLNDIVVTMKDASAADKLVDKIKADMGTCAKRKLTAEVGDAKKVTGTGAQKTDVSGWTFEVTQKSTEGNKKYRVGIVSAGTKVAYTFLNPQDGFDFTDGQWNTVAVRAGERTTQVN
ncbi:MAG TPA: hypothetical protein VIT20_09545 [Propionibacteriaceae bacterium]